MKYLETIFDDMPNLARQPSGQARRARNGVDIDEDLFAPAGGGRGGAKGGPDCGIVPSPILNPASSFDRAMPASLDVDDRPWPTLAVPPKQGPSPLEKKVADQERELSLRCTQVADLYNLQERLTAELQAAHGEIDRLNTAFNELQDTATHHVSKAAERKKAVTVLYQENAVLRGKLDKAHDETATLSRQMLSLETMFNDREAVITSALEQADLLKAQLAAANDEIAKLTATIDEANQRRQDEDSRQSGMVEDLKQKVESLSWITASSSRPATSWPNAATNSPGRPRRSKARSRNQSRNWRRRPSTPGSWRPFCASSARPPTPRSRN